MTEVRGPLSEHLEARTTPTPPTTERTPGSGAPADPRTRVSIAQAAGDDCLG
jgi:hypothetical protein